MRKKKVYLTPLVRNGWEVQVHWTSERTGALSLLPKLLIDFLHVYCLLIWFLLVLRVLQTLPATAGLVVRDVLAVQRGVLPGT